jgi:transposase-like protein
MRRCAINLARVNGRATMTTMGFAVHCNTMEGIWTGLRNYLRRFRGVHKKYLDQYVAIFEWAYNLKAVSLDYFRALLGGCTLNAS